MAICCAGEASLYAMNEAKGCKSEDPVYAARKTLA